MKTKRLLLIIISCAISMWVGIWSPTPAAAYHAELIDNYNYVENRASVDPNTRTQEGADPIVYPSYYYPQWVSTINNSFNNIMSFTMPNNFYYDEIGCFEKMIKTGSFMIVPDSGEVDRHVVLLTGLQGVVIMSGTLFAPDASVSGSYSLEFSIFDQNNVLIAHEIANKNLYGKHPDDYWYIHYGERSFDGSSTIWLKSWVEYETSTPYYFEISCLAYNCKNNSSVFSSTSLNMTLPLPGGLFLLASGLLRLANYRRRKLASKG
jgi:hypothetical protein